MSADDLPQPYGRAGLIVLALINLVGLTVIGAEMASIASWKTSAAGSYSMAEAAYLGSLWTKVMVFSLLLLAFDVFCLGVGVCMRISQLHRAVLSQYDLRTPSGGSHAPLPPGRLTLPI